MSGFQFDSFGAFVAMDGHGPYVWFCVALALVLVLGNWLALRRARHKFVLAARGRLLREQAERRGRAPQASSTEES